MKKNLLLFIAGFFFYTSLNAANFNVTISGFTYVSNNITVNVGDVVTIEASGFHPLIEVSGANWNAGNTTPLPGGFSSTSSFQLTITAGMAGTTIFYMCSAHGAGGMKGVINVNVIASINENNTRDFNFTVFPNPVSKNSFLNISTKKAGRISLTLYDVQGRIVKQIADMNVQAGELNMKFDAANLQKGNYVLLMRSGEGTLRRQIVVQ